MVLIKSDPHRRVEIPGVPAQVPRPVDIDPCTTGFKALRTLRIYRFDKGSVIEGHAEEDEVFIIVLAGSVELTLITDPSADPGPVMLSAPGGVREFACAAYLPPRGAYKLIPQTPAEVAYARATPAGSRLPKVFYSSGQTNLEVVSLLQEETAHAERLRFRLWQFDAHSCNVTFSPVNGSETTCEGEAGCEALLHFRTVVPGEKVATMSESASAPVWLNSGDTIAIAPGERLSLQIAKGAKGLALLVMAS